MPHDRSLKSRSCAGKKKRIRRKEFDTVVGGQNRHSGAVILCRSDTCFKVVQKGGGDNPRQMPKAEAWVWWSLIGKQNGSNIGNKSGHRDLTVAPGRFSFLIYNLRTSSSMNVISLLYLNSTNHYIPAISMTKKLRNPKPHVNVLRLDYSFSTVDCHDKFQSWLQDHWSNLWDSSNKLWKMVRNRRVQYSHHSK